MENNLAKIFIFVLILLFLSCCVSLIAIPTWNIMKFFILALLGGTIGIVIELTSYIKDEY